MKPEAPLTAKGIRQAQLLGEELQRTHKLRQSQGESKPLFDHIFVSPTVRTKSTASLITKNLGVRDDQIVLCDELLELTHGPWDGQLRSQYHTPQVIRDMEELGWDWKSPHGESLRMVENRMSSFILNRITPLLPQESSVSANDSSRAAGRPILNVLAVSHSIAIRTLLKSLLNVDSYMIRKHGLENTGVVEFVKHKEGWSLERWNDISHLKRADDASVFTETHL